MKNLTALCCILLLLAYPAQTKAQTPAPQLNLDLSGIDGIELTLGNVFNYRIDNRSQQTQQATITGRLQFRRSNLGFTYKYNVRLQPGTNNMSTMVHSPVWTYTDNALRELFQTYNKLPQGTYEYCVTIQAGNGGEQPGAVQPDACVYNTVDDIFLINLVSPENDAKLHEYNPMLNWTVNCRFANELTYRVRVAELKQGQTPIAAMTRNNPIYQDTHVPLTSTVYPVTARPLQKWQPYVWTVDAFYKGILLGGAETWKFTIVDDSLPKTGPYETFFVDIRQEHNTTTYYAVGKVKIKYVLDEKREESLSLTLRNSSGKIIKIQQQALRAIAGDNRFEIDLATQTDLKHMGKYILELRNSSGVTYQLPLTYINPDLLK